MNIMSCKFYKLNYLFKIINLREKMSLEAFKFWSHFEFVRVFTVA